MGWGERPKSPNESKGAGYSWASPPRNDLPKPETPANSDEEQAKSAEEDAGQKSE